MSAHARLAPSNAHRWMECPGSIRLSATLQHEAPSQYALLGTAAHALLELAMRLELDPMSWFGQSVENHIVDEDMTVAVGHAIDFVRTYMTLNPNTLALFEHRCNAGKRFGRKDLWGTGDIILDNYPEELVVGDYKHGVVVFVEVQDNKQLLIYLLGYLFERFPDDPAPWLRYKRIRLVIVQPRVFATAEPVREVMVTSNEVRDFALLLERKAAETDQFDAPFHPGLQCQYCRAGPVCKKFASYMLSVARDTFTDIDAVPEVMGPINSAQLTLAQYAWLLLHVPLFTAWVSGIKEHARTLLTTGQQIPGFKLVAGNRLRTWNSTESEDSIAGALLAVGLAMDEAAPRRLLSPAQVEATLKRRRHGKLYEGLEVLVDRSKRTAPQLVRDSDPRPALNPADTFDTENLFD